MINPFVEVWSEKFDEQSYVHLASVKAIRPYRGTWDKALIVTADDESYVWEHPIGDLWAEFAARADS